MWSGRFLGIITGWDPSVPKSNRLHVHTLRFSSFTKPGYILLKFPLKCSVIFLQSWSNFHRLFLKLDRFICNQLPVLFSPVIYSIWQWDETGSAWADFLSWKYICNDASLSWHSFPTPGLYQCWDPFMYKSYMLIAMQCNARREGSYGGIYIIIIYILIIMVFRVVCLYIYILCIFIQGHALDLWLTLCSRVGRHSFIHSFSLHI